MKHMVRLSALNRRFPYLCGGLIPMLRLVSDWEVDEELERIGLAPEERVFGHLFIAYAGDEQYNEPVGVFGGDPYTAPADETLTTIWWRGELTQPFQEANDYWEKNR